MPKDNETRTPVTVGRAYRGQTSHPIRTPEDVAQQREEQKKYDKPGAVTIKVYFATRGITSPIMQASLLAFTRVHAATVEDFDAIFEKHDGPKPAEPAAPSDGKDH